MGSSIRWPADAHSCSVGKDAYFTFSFAVSKITNTKQAFCQPTKGLICHVIQHSDEMRMTGISLFHLQFLNL